MHVSVFINMYPGGLNSTGKKTKPLVEYEGVLGIGVSALINSKGALLNMHYFLLLLNKDTTGSLYPLQVNLAATYLLFVSFLI